MAEGEYLTIKAGGEASHTEKRSRFLAFAIPVRSAEEVKEHVTALQKEYCDARHVCYAYKTGVSGEEWRAVDNGEPSGTAGKPILGQITSARLTYTLVVVVRYFGGIKLGTSGLTEAYRSAAAAALAAAPKVVEYVCREVELLFHYDMMNALMKLVKESGAVIINQDWGEFCFESGEKKSTFECSMLLQVRLAELQRVEDGLKKIVTPQPQPRLAYRIKSDN